MARTLSIDMPNVSIGTAGASAGLASLSWVALSVVLSGDGATADAPQNRNPTATRAMGISHFTLGRRGATEGCRGESGDALGGAGGRGGGVIFGCAETEAGNAPGRRP